MRRIHLKIITAGLMCLLLALPTLAGADEVGQFTAVEKIVDHQKGETAPPNQAKVKDPVEVMDMIRTHEQSRAQVTFRDKTIITVSPQSKVTVESYMYDPTKFERQADFQLFEGVVKVVVPTMEKGTKSKIMIKTPTAIMGVRGTEFVAVSGKGFAVVYGLKGKVCIKGGAAAFLLKEWKPSTAYKVGEGVQPLTPNGYLYQAIASGTSGSSEPAWPTKINATVTDSGVTWKCVAKLPEEGEEVCIDPGFFSVMLCNLVPTTPMPYDAEQLEMVLRLVSTGITATPGVLTTLPGINIQQIKNDLESKGVSPEAVGAAISGLCPAAPLTYTSPAEAAPPPPPPTQSNPLGTGQVASGNT
jgi:hypothetical protein